MTSGASSVLFLITSSTMGGAEKSLYDLATGLRAADISPDVVCLKERGVIGDRLRDAGIPFRSLDIPDGVRGISPTVAARRIVRRIIADHAPDIVHSILFRANLVARFARPPGHSPALVCGWENPETPVWKNALERYTRRRVDAYTCNAHAVRRSMIGEAHIPGRMIHVIYNGVPDDAFSAFTGSPAVDEWPQGDAARPRLLALGRLVPQKGFDTLLQAFVQVREQFPGAHLLIQGEGPAAPSLRATCMRLRITDSVRINEAITALPPLFAAADVCVLSSRYEGLPNVILEACAQETPVVATDVDGVREVITHEETGLLTPPNSPRNLAHTIARALENPTAMRKMADRARERVRREFSVARMVEAHVELYSRLLADTRESSLAGT